MATLSVRFKGVSDSPSAVIYPILHFQVFSVFSYQIKQNPQLYRSHLGQVYYDLILLFAAAASRKSILDLRNIYRIKEFVKLGVAVHFYNEIL